MLTTDGDFHEPERLGEVAPERRGAAVSHVCRPQDGWPQAHVAGGGGVPPIVLRTKTRDDALFPALKRRAEGPAANRPADGRPLPR